jgi:hypothetical protein
LVDGLSQRPGTEFLALLTSNAANGVFFHTINRDTDEQYIVLFTGDATEPVEIFDLAGVKQTVRYGTLDAAGTYASYSQDDNRMAYVLPWQSTDLITNGGFDTDTDWTKGTGWTISGGKADCDGTQVTDTDLYTSGGASIVDDAVYRVRYTISDYTAGSVKCYVGYPSDDWVSRSANGTYEEIHTANNPSDANVYFRGNSTFDAKIDDVSVVRLDTTTDPSQVFKAITVADNTFIINNGVTVEITDAVDAETLDYTIQTFGDLPALPADGETACITGDDVTGFDDWYVQYTLATDVWDECIKPGESLGEFKDFTMAYRLVHHADTTTFTVAPCIWEDRAVGDTNSTPTPSFVNRKIQNVFFYKNRLAFLSEDKVILSRTGEYFNFYTQTAMDVLDSDPIDLSATSKQVENLRSVAVFDKSLVLLADQQQFDFGSGDDPLTPTTVAITPTTRFNICKLCEPVTAGANVYFVCPKTDYATIREYYIQPDSLLNDAADVTAHVPNYIPMGHIQMAACNSLDLLVLHTDADPEYLYTYKYFWAGEEKAQAAWSKWSFSGDILGVGIIGTIAYVVLVDTDTSQITLEKMELESTVSGSLSFKIHADKQEIITGVYDSALDRTVWTMGYQVDEAETDMVVIHPTTGRPVVDAEVNDLGANVLTNPNFEADTDWTKGSGWTITEGKAWHDGSNSSLYQVAVEVGKTYRITFTITNYASGTLNVYCGSTGLGADRNADGTYTEDIVCAGNTTFYFTGSSGFVGSIDNVTVQEVYTTWDSMTAPGDLSAVDYHIAKKFEFRCELTPWYLKDQNGSPRLQGRLQVRTLSINYKDTGYFTVDVAATGRSTMTHVFSGAQIGVSVIGEVNLLSGTERFTVKGRNTDTTVQIASDSYLPVAFQSGSWEGIYYPRGRE